MLSPYIVVNTLTPGTGWGYSFSLGEVAMLDFFAEGTPVPQGSKNAYVRGGRAVLVDANPRLRAWRAAVRSAAEAAIAEAGWETLDEPCRVYLGFTMPRPKRPRWGVPAVKPDLDKLTRAVFDALTDAGVWRDDSRVVSMEVTKKYEDDEAVPGVWVEVKGLSEM